jgi:hypothetical protein
MKFKVGDVVIVINEQPLDPRDAYPYYKGYTFTVSQRVVDYNTPIGGKNFAYFAEDDYHWTVFEDRLELLEIYNSPLYKALNEDD